MTVAIPAVTFPSVGTGRDLTGHPPASGLLMIMAGPVAPAPGPGRRPSLPGGRGTVPACGCATRPPGCASWPRPPQR